MRLAHHLLRHTSGMWHLRLIIPRDLQTFFGFLGNIALRPISMRHGDLPIETRSWAFVNDEQSAGPSPNWMFDPQHERLKNWLE